jgi:hypothetical protein
MLRGLAGMSMWPCQTLTALLRRDLRTAEAGALTLEPCLRKVKNAKKADEAEDSPEATCELLCCLKQGWSPKDDNPSNRRPHACPEFAHPRLPRETIGWTRRPFERLARQVNSPNLPAKPGIGFPSTPLASHRSSASSQLELSLPARSMKVSGSARIERPRFAAWECRKLPFWRIPTRAPRCGATPDSLQRRDRTVQHLRDSHLRRGARAR